MEAMAIKQGRKLGTITITNKEIWQCKNTYSHNKP